MTKRDSSLFEQFLAPFFRTFLLDEAAMQEYRNSVDWEQERDRIAQPNVVYPDYYTTQNFHGIKQGYLNISAAVTYDPITRYLLPPNETWTRQELVQRVRVKPRRILDLGCGTGSTTLLLKQAFPTAEVIGLDLSPYMLIAARHKSEQANLDIQWQHGLAEQTGLADDSFDLVTASLLFHETPPEIAIAILQEAYRLLKVGGEVLILDGNQATLRQTPWLNDLFEEPYIRDYAQGSIDAWMGTAGFRAVCTEPVWLTNQVTRGIKPLPNNAPTTENESASTSVGRQPQWAMG
ncbi:MAG: class I SAM-dependent methyltransferase [Thainema sp.]